MHYIYLLICASFIFLTACGDPKPSENTENQEASPSSEEVLLAGKQLSEKYCANCHAYPAPDLLDKSTWRTHVLPRMGYMMGIYQEDIQKTRRALIGDGAGAAKVEAANVFPDKPILSQEDWKKIEQYYLNEAPEMLKTPKQVPIQNQLEHFKVKVPQYRLSPPSTTLVKINQDQTFYIGDANSKSLLQFDKDLQLQKAANVKEGAVWLNEIANNLLVTVMGSFSPTDEESGFLLALPLQAGQTPRVVLPDLQRPVHTTFADLNGDGWEDILTCEFAKWTGGLAWWENKKQNNFEKHVLRARPGAVKAYVQDFNNDQKLDVIALFGQGDEGIFMYYNQGDGKFSEEKVLSFPSSYGSSFFNIWDFNGDGHLDIIYTAGDNADYPPLMKPYHGIRIFFNDGKNQFSEKFFYHLNGAYQAIPADFDQDGDMDIAAISFFPDYAQERAEEGFVYLENTGKMQFKAYTFPEVKDGRWIVMDAGDLDQDGDLDILLGSLTFETIPKKDWVSRWVEKGIPFVLLENTIK